MKLTRIFDYAIGVGAGLITAAIITAAMVALIMLVFP
jgi:hypothetical protein